MYQVALLAMDPILGIQVVQTIDLNKMEISRLDAAD